MKPKRHFCIPVEYDAILMELGKKNSDLFEITG